MVPNDKSSPGHSFEHRLPSVATTPDGTTVLAYLYRKLERHDWQIRLVSIEFDAETKAPFARMADSLLVAEKSGPSRPASRRTGAG